jgi:peptidoglycan hydrolase-like protein with peptidoglycan-binding domain
VARASYLRPPLKTERSTLKIPRRTTSAAGSPRRGRFVVGGVLLLILALGAAAVLVLVTAQASLSADGNALAGVGMPMEGGTIQHVSAVTGPHSRPVAVSLRGDQIWPRHLLRPHQLVSIEVVVKRPGWISWLAGDTQRLHLTLMTPSASLRQHYLTLRQGAPLALTFKQPVRVIAYGQPGHVARRVLAKPLTQIRLKRTAVAGTALVGAAPRTWESTPPAVISWFPAGSSTASAVANPSPGRSILPHEKITLTFSKTVQAALGNNRPPVSPTTQGKWHTVNSHTIQFQPQGYGYGLGAHVSVGLPQGVQLIGAQHSGSSVSGNWTVPGGSPLRLQQLLAQLGYLPLRFGGRHVPDTPSAQEAAAVHPPAGRFTWRYPNVPSALKSSWAPGASGVMTKGALMAFQSDHGLLTDGSPGPAVWKSLINAAVAGHGTKFGYTFVTVNREASPQNLSLWHSGKTVMSALVNTGIASAPTAAGTYPVFEHLPVTTMSGTNPDGSHYSDPGIQYVSYFNGGDALHAFTRAQFGSPQSLGCVEMQLGDAAKVYPYTPIGTLVHVA